MTDWRVSVIMPVYCGEAFIVEALHSITRQDWPIKEIIVVDDGSTDDTASVVRQFPGRVRYVHQENRGPQHARNLGLSMACGNAIAFLDADDTWCPGKLAIQGPLLDTEDVVIGHTRIMNDPHSEAFILPSLNCALFRKSAFNQIGHLDPELEYSDDMDWYMRAREADLAIRIHDDVVLEHRRHDSNLTRNFAKKKRFHLLMLHKSILRRREKGIVISPLFSDFRHVG
ncbi:glycosyltransferase family 2 protein [Roseobacter sp. GAI101]|uniref:glycosyltransferase family 2 protein n=1 Tax=Roseobacter sp. (strain GAI101) TaxID=391589 RepID=UPI0001871B6A|nr:glycosyltransferase family A protein [Roseobacter sp. GAI101]EEB82680.1 glycosyl transferase, family 2 [Roseobacter sp. GAI101]